MNVTKGGTSRAVEKYGIASVIHKHTISSSRERHRLAALLSGVIEGMAIEIANTPRETMSPCLLTAGKISSDDFMCSSVANRSAGKHIELTEIENN